MDLIILVLILILVAIVVLGILAIFFIKAKEGKHKVDYYSLFIMGIIWLVVGILLENSALWILGTLFFAFGLANKDKWKKNKMNWKKITKKQKKIIYIIMVMLFLLVVAGIIVFWLTKEGLF
ncbi:hypothetical protein KAI04_02845 [Candidatus Pacearchaeota archaeon]|nr:hypothetical protein [Candidatus Pacearchaeota archaeon]